MKKPKRILFLLYAITALFLAMSLYLVYFQLIVGPKIVGNSYNRRNYIDETKILRGNFFDTHGTALTHTVGDSGHVMESPRSYAHIIGYNSEQYGKSGMEKTYNSTLLGLSQDDLFGRFKEIVQGQVGNDLHLTIDNDLQLYCYDLLEGHKGAIVVLDPSTGAIKAMVSRPSFNANEINELWENIMEDKSAPLLNRAAQGLYTPGSVMKAITAVAIMESGIDQDYHDTGEQTIDGFTYTNYLGAVHGEMDLRQALIRSANTYFTKKSTEVGLAGLKEVAEKFYFNKVIPFELVTSKSVAYYKTDMSLNDIAAAGFGQGDTLVTPLNMALSIGAIGNNGAMMRPNILQEIRSPRGVATYTSAPSMLSRVTTPSIARELTDDLVATVNAGGAATVKGIDVAGKTGSAENVSGYSHAWFAGFAPAENPSLALAIVLEEEGETGAAAAAPLARKIFQRMLRD